MALLPVDVVPSPVHGVVELADTVRLGCSAQGVTVGLLNPSDPAAVRGGYLGMYFDGGRGTMALEELLALCTTLLMGWTGPEYLGVPIVGRPAAPSVQRPVLSWSASANNMRLDD